MAWTNKQLLLCLLLVVTGSINTISTKWADTMKSENSAGEVTEFQHPFFQAEGMFIGEITCIIAFYVLRIFTRRQQAAQIEMAPLSEMELRFPKRIFLVPALCDMLATSTMYLGLTLTYASSFQMLRGAVIIFTGLLSVAFLGRKLRYFQWMGMFTVIVGLIVVGLSDFLGTGTDSDGKDLNSIITGDLLIIAAQVVTATQMVVEEKFITKYNVPPLVVVGWEGIFGFSTLAVLLVAFNYIPAGMFSGNPRGVLEDVGDAFIQLGNNPLLIAAIMGNIISIAFFNFAGVSVTKELSATTRMVLDSVRTLVVWAFSLIVKWQDFQYLQPIGFVVLVLGMCFYNDIIFLPYMRRLGWVNDEVEPTPSIDTAPSTSASVNESSRSSTVSSLAKPTPEEKSVTVEPL
ncbi:transport and golgi organization 9 isoform X2 [Oratosquilla oratoria]|uniref:transport and golgi organization 9 isoform X2 n=1 Tax=Oratosquilla oratoria TaxID=337810 RepID=UPI003F759435